MTRVLFTTAPLPGHFLPLAPLAWAFRAAGHDVLVATPENFVPAALGSGLPAAASGPATDFMDLIRDERPATLPEGFTTQRYVHGCAFARLAARNLAGVRSLVRSWKPDLVISERAEFAGPLAAVARGIPWIQYHWSVSRLREYRYAATERFGSELADLGLSEFPRPVSVLDPWPARLRLPHASAHQGVRHVPSNGAAQVPDWTFAGRERPRICVTLGTLLPRYRGGGVPDFMASLMEGLARLEAEILVAVDDDVAARWTLLPEAVRHVGRLPLGDVLPTCDMVVHHGGQGTALTALAAGRPQLMVPRIDDQFDNAEAVAQAGAGLFLSPPEATPEAVVKGCLELLENTRYAQAAAGLADEMALLPAPSALVGTLDVLNAGE